MTPFAHPAQSMHSWHAAETSTSPVTSSGQTSSASLSRYGDARAIVADLHVTPAVVSVAAIPCLPQDFGLTIDIDMLIDGIDTDGSGEIDFDEFRVLLTQAGGAS